MIPGANRLDRLLGVLWPEWMLRRVAIREALAKVPAEPEPEWHGPERGEREKPRESWLQRRARERAELWRAIGGGA